MDLALVIKTRLEELGLEQKDLAASAQVTESYISQLLGRKKQPPSAGRTEIYARISRFLELPEDELSKLAEIQRREKRKVLIGELPPLRPKCRDVIVDKCRSVRRREISAIFERTSWGELERLVTDKLLAVAKTILHDQLEDKRRLAVLVKLSGWSLSRIRREGLELLTSEPFQVPDETCAAFLRLLVDSWDIDLKSFKLEVTPSCDLAPGQRRQFEFVETAPSLSVSQEEGFQEFLADASLSGDATQTELEYLRKLEFDDRRPTRFYYYRELQNLRDPLNFGEPPIKRPSAKKKMSASRVRV